VNFYIFVASIGPTHVLAREGFIGERKFIHIYAWIEETKGFVLLCSSRAYLLRVVSLLLVLALIMVSLRLSCVIGLLACLLVPSALLSTDGTLPGPASRLKCDMHLGDVLLNIASNYMFRECGIECE